MPKGPRGEKRPADVVGCAVMVAKIATGEIEEQYGTTAYLKNGGTLEKAAVMANHASTRTTQLYDRPKDELSLNKVERILI